MNYTKIFPADYPPLLKSIKKQPTHLYLAGSVIKHENYKFLCVVGARRYSNYGQDVCRDLIRGLRNYPVVIVSGLALGIDSLAHTYALENNLKTIAVPGSGLNDDVIYPPSHLQLARHIVNSGNTLLSPFEPHVMGNVWTFPVRNQLMAALSDATLVVEGRKKSGTLLTANYTLELDREVMIVPGSIYSELSYGPHTLYKEGAHPITNSREILEVLGFDMGDVEPKTQELFDFNAIQELNPRQKMVINCLQFRSSNSYEITQSTGMSASEFLIIASELELLGLIKQSQGFYRICRS